MILETNLHLAADRLSNREFDDLTIMDEWLEEAGEALKEVLRKQLSPPPETSDVLRMSSVGKPLCQLQMQAAGAKAVADKWEPMRERYHQYQRELDIYIADNVVIQRSHDRETSQST